MLNPEQTSRHRDQVHRIVTRAGDSDRTKKLKAWTHVLESEIELGTRFICTDPEGHLFMVLGATRQILMISKRDGSGRLSAYLTAMYGLSDRDDFSKFVTDNIRAYAQTDGTKVELRRFACYVGATQTAYLSNYNGQMWKLDGTSATLVPNGEDEVFFADDDGGQTVDPDINPHGIFVERLASLNYRDGIGGILPDQQRMAWIMWLFALAFPDLMPTKPLLLLEGTEGSGKSAAVQLAQIALMGRKKPITVNRTKEDSFGILLLRSPIALFDNTDSYIDWLPDAVCSYATSGQFPRRKLWSDDEEIIVKPHAFIAVASKNPASFRREDTVDRTIVLRLERRTGFKRMRKLEEQILADRDKLFGEYLWIVNRLVAEVKAGGFDDSELETHRMADFAAFGRLVGRVIGWEPEAVTDLMNAMQREREALTAEEDPLMELLARWIIYRTNVGGANIGREVSINTLFAELESIAQAKGMQNSYYKSPRILAQKLRAAYVQREYDVEIGSDGNQKTYKLYRKTDPKLGVIDGGLVDVSAIED